MGSGCGTFASSCDELKSLSVAFNNVLRKIEPATQQSFVHSGGQTASVYNIIYNRLCNLISSALSHPSTLISAIFKDSFS